MPRPQKKRHVCCMPRNSLFVPANTQPQGETALTVDEYETLRLIDLEGNTQEACARQMHVSRTTVQGIYNNARRKTADALVHGKSLRIAGGDYIVCARYRRQCGRGCHKRCRQHPCTGNQED